MGEVVRSRSVGCNQPVLIAGGNLNAHGTHNRRSNSQTRRAWLGLSMGQQRAREENAAQGEYFLPPHSAPILGRLHDDGSRG